MSTKRARCLVLSVVCLLSCVFAESAFAASEISVVREWDNVEIPSSGSFGFGLAPANTPDSRRFRIYNTGNTNLVISNPTTLVSGEGFSMIAEPVGTVHAGMSTTFRVQFLASAPGDYHGAITIHSNDADESPYVVHLYGGVTPPPSPDIAVVREWDGGAVPSGGSFSFGTEPANTPDSRIFRIHNTGNTDLNISNPTTLVSGDGFSMIAYPVGTVYAGASTIFRVQFVASAPGDYHGAITIHSNDPDENPYVIQLHGAVNPPAGLPDIAVVRNWDDVAVPSGGSFSFGIEPANTPDSRIFRIHNTGNANLVISNPTTLVSGEGFSMIAYPVGTVYAGASTIFRVQFQASAPGDYYGTITIHSNDPDENPYTIHLAGTVVGANGATFISQNFPAAMAANQFYDVSVTMKNSGTTTWTAAKNYRLGVRPDTAASTWRFTGRVDLSSTESIAPGATKTFSFRLQAPSTPGSYSLQWRMVEEMVEWFGDTSPLINVTVGAPPNNAAFVSQSVPTNMIAGQTYSVSVTVQNTGSKTWSETTRHRLGSQVAGDPWGPRILLPAGVTVAPGQQYTFSFQVPAPSTPGTYNFQWRMVEELVEWFGATTPPTTITVTVGSQPNDAAFVSQSVPATMNAGQQYTVSVTMRNTGTKTWSETTRHRLGTQVAGDPWGPRILLPAGVTVAPGQQYTFSFQVTAPATAGTYNFTWRMVEELVEWFGAATPNVPVSVTAGDFNVSVRPDFMRVQRGKSITATVSVAGLFGFNSPVSLSVIDLPAGTTASFQPASILPGGSSTLTINAASSGPFGDFSIRVRGTSGGVTRNMTATLRVMDPQAKPAITAIQPETIPAGETSTVTLTGMNFHTSAVTVGNAEADRAFPTIQVVNVSADGTRMELQVDARDPAVLHHYALYVKNLHGEDGISFRVIPAAPVIDFWSPSEAAGGTIYAMDLVGVNLQGATVVSPGGVSVFDVDNSEDEFLSAFLKVEAGASGPVNLIIRGRNGADATVRIDIRQQRSEVLQKTSALTNSKGEPLFYMQDLKPREDLVQSKLAKNPASVHGGFEFQICAEWGRSRSRGRVWNRTWFRNPLTGEYGPLADAILDNLRIGEIRLLETTTFSRWFFLELSMHFRICYADEGGFDYDVEACITGAAGFHIPIVGGVALEFEFCLGNPSRYEIRLEGTGLLSFINFHRRGNTGQPEELQCVRIDDRNPSSLSGERTFEVELLACCSENVGVGWGGEFYLGFMQVNSQEAGTAQPGQACPLHTVTIQNPPHNPDPPDLGNNFSFLAQREFADTANGDIIQATATVTPAVTDLNEMIWTITADIGGIRQVNPADRRGSAVSFVPDPPDHPNYLRGTGCNNPGNGSCDASTPLGYLITAQYEDHQDANQIVQDQTDVIRQEYRNHGITIPGRNEFNRVFPTLNFDVAEINNTAYDIVVGTPGTVAQNVRDEYNRRIHDDEQLQPFGRDGLPPNVPVVGPGAHVQEIGAILTTPRCNGAPNPATCDDVRVDNMILAGNNGIVETQAVNRITNQPIEINSAWRNPERNEAVGGVLTSRHQFGNAVDLDNELPREGLTTAQLFCILQTAADAAGYNGFAEQNSAQRPCASALVTHVHVQD
jgi:hypothetical protein